MSDNIHNTEKFVPKISLLMSFYHNFSFLMPVFGLHRAVLKALYEVFENPDGIQNSKLAETRFPQLSCHCSSEDVHPGEHPDSTTG